MGKTTKGFIITAVVMIALGFVVTISTVAAGGIKAAQHLAYDGHLGPVWFGNWGWSWNDNSWSWSNDSWNRGDLSGNWDNGHGFYINDDDDEMYDDDYEIYYDDIDKSFAVKDIRNLELEVGRTEFDVESSDDNNIHIKTNKIEKIQAYTDNGTLVIRGRSNNVEYGKIQLEIPKNYQFDHADLSVGAGELDIDELKATFVKSEVGAGVVEIDNLVCEGLEVEIGAGATKIEKADIKNATIRVGVGALELDGRISDNLDAECDLGSIKMKLDGNEMDHNYELSCSMGNLTVGSHSFAGINVEKEVDNEANSSYDVTSSMGSIEIKFRD